MVLIHVQKGNNEDQQFLFETTVTAIIGDVARDIAEIHNRRLQIQRLAAQVQQLAKFGPMKQDADRGLSGADDSGDAEEKVQPEQDPAGLRVGEAPAPQLATVLERTAADALAAVHVNQLKNSRALTRQALEDTVQNLKGAVTIAYPQGLPEWDPIREILEGREDISNRDASKDVVAPAQAVLWFAGKQLSSADPLSKAVGKNEKVKIKVKLAKSGQSAPQRDPAMDEETRRNMMALYHKKQQEAQKAEEDEEDSYLNSSWANPKAFHAAVSGVDGIRYRPF